MKENISDLKGEHRRINGCPRESPGKNLKIIREIIP